jgi:hypothetical protein
MSTSFKGAYAKSLEKRSVARHLNQELAQLSPARHPAQSDLCFSR